MNGSDVAASTYRQTQQSPCRTLSTQASAFGEDVLSHYEGMELEGNSVGYAMEMLAKADAVCFDVDSTVIDEEGIVSSLCAVLVKVIDGLGRFSSLVRLVQ
jgi:hypothetical protein